MKEDLLQQIEQMMPTFSKSQKLIASYILNHYEKSAYMTALKLGNAVNVSNPPLSALLSSLATRATRSSSARSRAT